MAVLGWKAAIPTVLWPAPLLSATQVTQSSSLPFVNLAIPSLSSLSESESSSSISSCVRPDGPIALPRMRGSESRMTCSAPLLAAVARVTRCEVPVPVVVEEEDRPKEEEEARGRRPRLGPHLPRVKRGLAPNAGPRKRRGVEDEVAEDETVDETWEEESLLWLGSTEDEREAVEACSCCCCSCWTLPYSWGNRCISAAAAAAVQPGERGEGEERVGAKEREEERRRK